MVTRIVVNLLSYNSAFHERFKLPRKNEEKLSYQHVNKRPPGTTTSAFTFETIDGAR